MFPCLKFSNNFFLRTDCIYKAVKGAFVKWHLKSLVFRLFPANSSLFKAGSVTFKQHSIAMAKSTLLHYDWLRSRQLTNNFLCICDACLLIIVTQRIIAEEIMHVYFMSVYFMQFVWWYSRKGRTLNFIWMSVCLDPCSKLHYSYMEIINSIE